MGETHVREGERPQSVLSCVRPLHSVALRCLDSNRAVKCPEVLQIGEDGFRRDQSPGRSSAQWRRAIDAAFYNRYDPRTELGVPCSSPLLLARSTLWPGRQAIVLGPNFRRSLSRNRNRLSWICLERAATLTWGTPSKRFEATRVISKEMKRSAEIGIETSQGWARAEARGIL